MLSAIGGSLIGLGVLLAPLGGGQAQAGRGDGDASGVEQAVFERINAERAGQGLPELAFDASVLPLARARAEAQAGGGALSHAGLDGSDAIPGPLSAAGVGYLMVGENLGRVEGADPAAAVELVGEAFMASPPHRANVLEAGFTHASVGASLADGGRVDLAVIFRTAP
jgi:uncharacterized protein YkwD